MFVKLVLCIALCLCYVNVNVNCSEEVSNVREKRSLLGPLICPSADTLNLLLLNPLQLPLLNDCLFQCSNRNLKALLEELQCTTLDTLFELTAPLPLIQSHILNSLDCADFGPLFHFCTSATQLNVLTHINFDVLATWQSGCTAASQLTSIRSFHVDAIAEFSTYMSAAQQAIMLNTMSLDTNAQITAGSNSVAQQVTLLEALDPATFAAYIHTQTDYQLDLLTIVNPSAIAKYVQSLNEPSQLGFLEAFVLPAIIEYMATLNTSQQLAFINAFEPPTIINYIVWLGSNQTLAFLNAIQSQVFAEYLAPLPAAVQQGILTAIQMNTFTTYVQALSPSASLQLERSLQLPAILAEFLNQTDSDPAQVTALLVAFGPTSNLDFFARLDAATLAGFVLTPGFNAYVIGLQQADQVALLKVLETLTVVIAIENGTELSSLFNSFTNASLYENRNSLDSAARANLDALEITICGLLEVASGFNGTCSTAGMETFLCLNVFPAYLPCLSGVCTELAVLVGCSELY